MDPFRNYDAWLEEPYQRAQERGDAITEELERRDLFPPHAAGNGCPRCGWDAALVENDPAEWHVPPVTLYCEHCGEQIDRSEDPTYEPDPQEYEPDPDRMRDERDAR